MTPRLTPSGPSGRPLSRRAMVGRIPAALAGTLWSLRQASAQAPTRRQADLDRLFEALAAAGSEDEARRIERDIWTVWTHHPDPALDALMRQVLADRRAAAFERALERIDRVLAADPAYAEAYNQRAIIEFHRGNFFESLTAIDETLRREPRHFGAMAGRAIIRLRQNKPALAVQNLLAATEVHPYLRERHLLAQFGMAPGQPKTPDEKPRPPKRPDRPGRPEEPEPPKRPDRAQPS